MNKKILTSITIAFVLAVVYMTFMPTSVAYATQYGNKDSSDLETFWYYSEENLNVAAMKESIASWIAGADKSNPVVIAVVDTGVNVDHEVFQKTNTLYTVDGKVQGYNSFVSIKNSGITNPTSEQLAYITDETSNSHGTAIASIMAMLIYELGLQDYIKIYPIKATRNKSMVQDIQSSNDREKKLRSFPTDAVVGALDYVKNTQDTIGIDVVNLSIAGYKDTADGYKKNGETFRSLSEDCVIVAAAGNENDPSSTNPAYPASLDGVLSVMAYGKDGNKTQKSNFGNYDVTAPGQDIYVAQGNSDSYAYEDGTSMSSAFLSVISAVVELREQTAKSGKNSIDIAKHLIASSRSTIISHNNYNLPKFDSLASVQNQIIVEYVAPTGLQISNDKNIGDNSIIYRGEYDSVLFSAKILPLGETDPNLLSTIRWSQTELLSRPVVDEEGNQTGTEIYDGNKVELGTGESINYIPNVNGKYRITASLTVGETTIEQSMIITIKYVEYSSVAGLIEIKPVAGEGDTLFEDGAIYEYSTVTFYLAGAEGLDPTVDIKWYVDGELAHTGATFTYNVGMMGSRTITAQYGDYRVLEKAFTFKVKSGFLRPEAWISFTAVVGALAITGTVLGIVLAKKKAKKA